MRADWVPSFSMARREGNAVWAVASVMSFLIAGAWNGLGAVERIPERRSQEMREAAPETAPAEPERPRRVLIFNTPAHLMEKDPHKGYCIPYGAEAFRILGEKTGAYEPVVSDDLALMLPENLRRFDAVVLNNASQSWITPTDADLRRESFQKHGATSKEVEEALRRSLLDFVAQGGGVAAVHYAIGANRHWPAFQQLLGASYDGHPWNEEVAITVESPNHPITAAFEGKGFRIADEIYQFREPYSRTDLRVLLSLNPQETRMDAPWIRRSDNDFALAWVKTHGRGRVFYTALGHRTEIYFDPRVLAFFLAGVQFATGDLGAPSAPSAVAETRDEEGFESIFDGTSLDGWDGDSRIWSVQEGAITGETTEATRLRENNFLIWEGGRPGDFELRCRFKLLGGNTGIYFHAEKRPPGSEGEPLVGPQADFSADHRWTGVLMEYTKRDVLAERGQRTLIDENGVKHVIGSVGRADELLKAVRDRDWNDYAVIARGEWVALKINGVTMCEVIDRDPRRTPAGHLALQTHTGPPMRVQFKDIRLKTHP